MRKKYLLQGLSAIFLTVIVFFFVAELTVRFLDKTHRSMPVTYLEKEGYYTYPNLAKIKFNNESGQEIIVETDEFGLRNHKGALRGSDVILLGDSFLMAVNTPEDDTLAGFLRKSGLKVYNAGMDGFSTFQAYWLLSDLLRVKTPRLVILGFYLGNDFRDNYLEPLAKEGSGNLNMAVTIREPVFNLKHRIGAAIKNLLKDSRLFQYLYNQLYLGLYKGYFSSPMASYSLSEMESYRLVYTKEMSQALEKTDIAISWMESLLKGRNIDFLIIGIPSKAQVAQSFSQVSHFYYDKRSKNYSLDVISQGYSFSRPDAMLKEITAKRGIRYLSLLEEYRKIGAEKLYYKNDSHWNADTQKICSEFILTYLQK